MKIDTLDERYELIKTMIDEAFEFEESVANMEDDNDWAGAMTTLDNLVAMEDMICAEEIFLNTFGEMEDLNAGLAEKEIYLGIFDDNINFFIETILMPRLKHSLEVLSNWGFRTERGKEFEKSYREKLDALIKKYEELYDV